MVRSNLLPRLVLAVELAGERVRAVRVLLEEEPHAAAGVVEPSGRVDPRSEPEPDLTRRDLRPLGDPGDPLERAQAGATALREHLEPPANEDPVRADERHDVRDRAEGDEIEGVLQVRLRTLGAEPAALAQRSAERHRERERHADRGEVLRWVAAAGLVRVQDRGRRRQLDRHRVVIDDDRVHAEGRGRAHLRGARDAAVERDEEAGPLRRRASRPRRC